MITFIGLGNPGDAYTNTKHNAGFWVMDELSRRWKTPFKPGKGDYLFAQSKNGKALLVKPTTGMNASGIAVQDIVKSRKLNLENLFIILDDVDLPLGTMRIRPKGGDGCHRGMESVIYRLGSTHFPRIRFGIGTEENMRPAEKYVLKKFRKNDQALANEMVGTVADAAESVFFRGLNHTMNVYNR